MKKTIFAIALTAIMLITTSAFNEGDNSLRKGDNAPQLILEGNVDTLDLNEMRGNYVLLTFWSSTDAQSRIECNKYTAWMNANASEKIQHICINFDSEAVLFQEIAKRDHLDAKAQFNVNGAEAEKIAKDFHLNEGFGSMLIDANGKIASINPTTNDLSMLI